MLESLPDAELSPSPPDVMEVVFQFQHQRAQQVFVIGQFNNWSTTATPMNRTGDDRWEASVMLPSGCHHYCYWVINESWFNSAGDVPNTPTAVVYAGSTVRVEEGRRVVARDVVAPG